MAYLLSSQGQRVLLIDNDIQGNASSFYKQTKMAGVATIADIFRGTDIHQAIRETEYPNLSIIMGDMDLATVNIELMARQKDGVSSALILKE